MLSLSHERVYEKAVGWRRTPHRGVRPTESLGRFGGPDRRHDPAGARAVTRLDESRLGATLRRLDGLEVTFHDESKPSPSTEPVDVREDPLWDRWLDDSP